MKTRCLNKLGMTCFVMVVGCVSSGTVPVELYLRSERARAEAERKARATDELNRRLIANAASVAVSSPTPSSPGVPAASPLPSAEPAPALGPHPAAPERPARPTVSGWNQIVYAPNAVGTPFLFPRPFDWGADPREVARPGRTHGSCNPRDTITFWNKNEGVRMDVQVTFQNAAGQTLEVYPEELAPPWGRIAVCPPSLREIGATARAWRVHYRARYCAEEPDGTCEEVGMEQEGDSIVPFRSWASAPYNLGVEIR